MDASQRDALAKYLGVAGEAQTIPASARCTATAAPFSSAVAWNGWGNGAANSRFQSAKAAGLNRTSVPKLKLKWAFGFPGATTAFSQPTVYGGKLFVGSAEGSVYALNARTGCIYWSYAAEEGVRTAVTVANGSAYFGDLHGYVYALNANTGALLWKTHVDEHPFAVITGSPKLEGGRLFVPVSAGDEPIAAGNPKYECCTFRGSLVALDAASGKQIWKTYTISEPAKVTGTTSAGVQSWAPSGVSLWSSPTIDLQKRVIYVGTGINFTEPTTENSDAILAIDMDSGKQLWSRQLTQNDAFNFGCNGDNKANCPKNPGKDADFGHSPMLVSIGGLKDGGVLKDGDGGKRLLIVGQKSGMLHALDAEQNGKIIWQKKLAEGGGQGGIMWGPAADDKGIGYFAISDWNPGKPEAGGGMIALKLATGEMLWSTGAPKPACVGTEGCSAAQAAPVTAIPGVVFSGSMDGHLRAFDAVKGGIIWDFDSLKDFTTVDGVKARGGSLNGAGVTVVGGMLYTNSGYARIPAIAGNVLLAFSVDGK